MDPNLNLRIVHQRAQAANRRAERFGQLAADRRLAASPDTDVSVTVRLATANDGPAIVRVSELDSTPLPKPPLLVGERDGRIVAALSLRDGVAAADPFVPTADVVALLQLRARQLGQRVRPIRRLSLASALSLLRGAESQ
jgi:hypothetical protein